MAGMCRRQWIRAGRQFEFGFKCDANYKYAHYRKRELGLSSMPTEKTSALTTGSVSSALSAILTATTSTTSSSTTTAGASAPTQSGTASNCDQYHTVMSGDSCTAIETQYCHTFTELYQWNLAIGSNCENLWVGYAVCVGVL
jgi:hypothetical protein